MLYRTKVDVLF